MNKRILMLLILSTVLCACGGNAGYTEPTRSTAAGYTEPTKSTAGYTEPTRFTDPADTTQPTAHVHSYDYKGSCTCGAVSPDTKEFITFHDIFLENSIKQALGIQGANKVSKYAMTQLKEFEIENAVTDVQDLKYATNLECVGIAADNVKNLSVLCGLAKIKEVAFGFGTKVDISFMKDMKTVEYIHFSGAEIVGGELSDLVSSPNLTNLYYTHSGGGIAFLEGANSLVTLEVRGVFNGPGPYDISVLKTLPNLQNLSIPDTTATAAHRAVYTELLSKGVCIEFE